MNRVLAILASCFLDLFEFVVAALAASAFMHLIFLGSAGFTAADVPWLAAGSFAFSIPFIALFVAYFAFLPTLPVILLGEILARRDWLFYALGGLFVGLAVAGFFWGASLPVADGLGLPDQPQADPAFEERGFLILLVASGIAGGLAYWLVTGQFAGAWRSRSLPRG